MMCACAPCNQSSYGSRTFVFFTSTDEIITIASTARTAWASSTPLCASCAWTRTPTTSAGAQRSDWGGWGGCYGLRGRFLARDPFRFNTHIRSNSLKDCDCKSLHYRFGPNWDSCVECGHTPMFHYSHFNRTILNPIQRSVHALMHECVCASLSSSSLSSTHTLSLCLLHMHGAPPLSCPTILPRTDPSTNSTGRATWGRGARPC
jgi:hypothetical protein